MMKTKVDKKPEPGLHMLSHGDIRPSPTNPRKTFDPAGLEELKASILEHGIVQPLVVRWMPAQFSIQDPDLIDPAITWLTRPDGKKDGYLSRKRAEEEAFAAGGEHALQPYFELVAGERRWRAAGLAEVSPIPCLVRELSETDVLEIQYIENLQRRDLSPLEEAEGFRQLIASGKYTAETLGQKLGLSRSAIFNRLRLTRLLAPVREALAAGQISPSIAERISQVPGLELQEKVLNQAVNGRHGHRGPMSVTELESLIGEEYTASLKKAPFDKKDELLVPEHGACADCPHRSGNMLADFPETTNPDVCTNVACFQAKVRAGGEAKLAKALQDGRVVVPQKEFLAKSWSFELASSECYFDAKRRSWGQLAKAALIQPALVQDRDGQVVEVLTPTQKKLAEKQVEKEKDEESPGRPVRVKTKEELEREELTKRRNAMLQAARTKLILENSVNAKGMTYELVLILAEVLAMFRETNGLEEVVRSRLSLTEEEDIPGEEEQGLVKVLMRHVCKNPSMENATGLLVDLCLDADMLAWNGTICPTFTEQAKVLGLDLAQFEEEWTAEQAQGAGSAKPGKGKAAEKAKPEAKAKGKAGKKGKK